MFTFFLRYGILKIGDGSLELKYKRVLLKISGEYLATPEKQGINFEYLLELCSKIKECHDEGLEIGIVVGGGNFWRGRSSEHMDRITADHIGMLGTTMNALAIGDAFKQCDCEVRVLTAIEMKAIAEPFCKNRALKHLDKGRILVFGCGTGNPFFSTDSAAALRAAEIDADAIIKLTNVDGIYDKDPNKYEDAKMYSEVSYGEVLEKNLKVMDATAIALARDNKTPIIILNIKDFDNIVKVIHGESVGTLVTTD